MGCRVIVSLSWSKRSESIDFRVDQLLYLFKSNRSKSIDKLIEVQFARTSFLVAKTIELIRTIRHVLMTHWHFDDDRIPNWASISVDNL